MKQNKRVWCHLREFIDKRNLSAKDVVVQTKLNENTVYAYLNNKRDSINSDVAIRLCEWAGCSLGEMFSIVEGR